MSDRFRAGPWPPPPGWPPEVPPPYQPNEPRRPGTPSYPPVPIVYEPSPRLGDDLADRLLEQRIVRVSGPLDLATANDASARLMLLDGTGDEPIDLVMSCPDGELVAATALADTVELVGVEVRVLCSGLVGGPVVLPYALATRRLAQPHATFRLGNPAYEVQGRAAEVVSEVDRHAEQVAELHRRFADATHQPLDSVVADFDRRRLLTAPEARTYGLVDEIVHRGGLRTV